MTVAHGTKGADLLLGALDEANELWGHREGDTLVGGKLEDLRWIDHGDDSLR